MTTADLALRFDPEYEKISRRFLEDFDYFSDQFARAWFKLTHRDMGPIDRYLGKEVPTEQLVWQDPVPVSITKDIDVESIKNRIKSSDIPMYHFVYTAWASASTFRKTDKRGGANGARILLEPQRSWEVNDNSIISNVAEFLATVQKEHMISMADLIVLAGCAAIEKASGEKVEVPFTPGRGDATQEQTDIESFKVLEPIADGFRNYIEKGTTVPSEVLLVEKANMLNLTPVEMVVLLAGMRTLVIDTLNNGYLNSLLSGQLSWKQTSIDNFQGYVNGELVGNASRADLITGSNSELRAIAEVYASDDADEKFINDFAKVWDKVMMLDRFDVKNK
jgi:catalase-peroxidase